MSDGAASLVRARVAHLLLMALAM